MVKKHAMEFPFWVFSPVAQSEIRPERGRGAPISLCDLRQINALEMVQF
ncbi:hypothetical protein GGD89_001138 [Roseospira visakhapatnamensis]|uniref:Uncharacterized protein n=1 Tax=Roseospira visakhapatnamensis TaxID=390880 RepID=A0A7W6W947_9PROT|nr:hypothetical protein [Roseospira visakhapatnamensis]